MKKRLSLAPIFIILFGLGMACLALFLMLENQTAKIEKRTLSHAFEIREGIEREFLWSENILRGIEGFFHASKEVSREEFLTFCRSSIHEGIPLHLIEWQPKVHSSERGRFEENARRDGLKEFEFFEIDQDGNEVKAGNREHHFPVFYSYSPNPFYQAVGLDLSFSPLRMKSKYQSMRTGKPVLSETFDVILKENKKRNLGFAITYPVFKDYSISASKTLEPLNGFIAIVLYVREFFAPLSDEEEIKNFQFEVSDLVSEKEKLIYSNVEEGRIREDLASVINFQIGGRNWILKVYPTGLFIEREKTGLPYIIFILIILFAVALSYYLYMAGKNLQKINDYERQIQQKLESLGILSSGIAHEFNNILHCISLAIENFKYSKEEKVKNENIEVSLEFCHKGRDLVRQLLSFSRKDSGQQKKVLPSKEILKSLEFLIPSLPKGVRVEVAVDKQNDRPLIMSENHIGQILMNLINNAVYAIEEEGIIHVTYSVTANERILSVKDDGEGMEPEVREKVFDPFFTTKPVNEGTGLGLSVIYGIVKSYGGDIEVFSLPGEGSEFRVIFKTNDKNNRE